jgi:hypothetical protein
LWPPVHRNRWCCVGSWRIVFFAVFGLMATRTVLKTDGYPMVIQWYSGHFWTMNWLSNESNGYSMIVQWRLCARLRVRGTTWQRLRSNLWSLLLVGDCMTSIPSCLEMLCPQNSVKNA